MPNGWEGRLPDAGTSTTAALPRDKSQISGERHHRHVPTKLRAADLGTRLGLSAIAELGRVTRDARLAAGLSQTELAVAAGMSKSAVARYESGHYRAAKLLPAARMLRVLGHEMRLAAYPAGTPLRDAGHAKLVGRILDEVGDPLRYGTDVPLPNPGDMRAWDILLMLDRRRVALEAEMRLRDLQELVRRVHTKRRDGMVDGLVIVLADTRHNRSLLPALEAMLPDYPRLSGARFVSALREGRLPPDGIVLF